MSDNQTNETNNQSKEDTSTTDSASSAKTEDNSSSVVSSQATTPIESLIDESKQPTTSTVSERGPESHPVVLGSPPQHITPKTSNVSSGKTEDSGSSIHVSRTSRRLTLKRSIVLVIILMILVGGGAFGYYGYYLPSRPVNILKQALINTVSTGNIKSLQFNGTITTSGKQSSEALNGSFSGGIGEGGKFSIASSFDIGVTNLSVDALSPDGQNVYVKLGGLSGLSQLLKSSSDSSPDSQIVQSLLPIISSINNQWYEIDHSLISQVEQTGNYQKTLHIAQLNKTNASKLGNIYEKYSFLNVDQSLPSQSIDGLSSYHYKVIINIAQLDDFLSNLNNANLPGIALSQSNINSLKHDLGTAKVSNKPFDVWISKSSKLIDQIYITLGTAGNTSSYQITFSHFNQPYNVQTPASSKSLLQLFGQLSPLLQSSLSKSAAADSVSNPSDLINNTDSLIQTE